MVRVICDASMLHFLYFGGFHFVLKVFFVIMVLLVHTKSHLFGISDLVDISVVHAFFLFLANLFYLGLARNRRDIEISCVGQFQAHSAFSLLFRFFLPTP